ncbi:MAG: phosphoethanolamine transferase [Synergistaceae bacterium]|nr:phosphoethanolamine transferase [Synergistaceae bacterium]
MRKVRDFIYEWLEQEESFIFLMVLLNVTASYVTYQFFFEGLQAFIREFLILVCDIFISFLMVCIIDLFLYVSLRKLSLLHKTAKFIFVAVNVLMFCTDIFTLYHYKFPLNSIMFEIITNTNAREGSEFLQAYLNNLKFWSFAAMIIASAILLRCVWVKIFNKRPKFRFATFVIFFLLGIFALGRQFYTNGNFGFVRAINSVGLTRLASLHNAHKASMKEYDKMINDVPKNATLTKNKSTIPYIVYILGESTTRNHMSLYGYKLPTNPLLSQRKDSVGGGVHVFDDTVSPHASTAASMKKIFNFYNYESKNDWYTYQNIFNIFKTAGYRTVWISVQENSVFSSIGPSAIYSHLCNTYEFTNALNDNSNTRNIRDETLLPLLDKELETGNQKFFFLLHLVGAHMHYHKRYTAAFRKFTADDEFNGKGYDGFSQRLMRANYDNAILYNDFIIDEIIKRFEDKNAILFYISDHGEEVYDNIDFFGHGDVGPYSRSLIEIPFIIWTSEKFREQYPELEKRIAASVHRPYMTDDLIHTILDITGIETEDYDPTRSVINEKFNAERPRIFMNFIYDKEKGLSEIQ